MTETVSEVIMELDWITPQQAAKIWGITDRRIQALCANGQVDNAIKLGRVWLIPKDAPKPKDGRKNNSRKVIKSDIEK